MKKKKDEKPHEYLNDALELRALLQMESCDEAMAMYGEDVAFCPVCGAIYDGIEEKIIHKDPSVFKRN